MRSDIHASACFAAIWHLNQSKVRLSVLPETKSEVVLAMREDKANLTLLGSEVLRNFKLINSNKQ